MIKNYFKTAFRNLWKNKIYGSLNVFGLAIGIACAGLIFLWVEDEFSYNHNHSKKDQLYQILENQPFEGKTYTFSATPGLLAEAMKKEFPELKIHAVLPGKNILYLILVKNRFMKEGIMLIHPSSACLPFHLCKGIKKLFFSSFIRWLFQKKWQRNFLAIKKTLLEKHLRSTIRKNM
jgi:hypothetical protein